MDDSQIIALYLQRDERAVSETDKKYNGYCMQIARNILRSEQDAAEVVNEAFFAVWQSIPPNHPETLTGYIGRITRTLCLKRLRTAYTAKRGGGETALALEELSGCVRAAENVEQTLEAKELAQYINRFLRNLPAAERNAFICRYWYFHTIEEIAQQFGCTKSKVKSMLFRTRKKLREMLTKEGLL